MDDRLKGLEVKVAELAASVKQLQTRLEALEGGSRWAARGDSALSPAVREAEEGPAEIVAPLAPVSTSVVSLIGRSCLVFCGAFLLRALTDAGTLPQGLGVVLGLLYAATWMVVAQRGGGDTRRLSAEFHGVTAVIIGYPLLVETTIRFGAVRADVAALALVALTVVGLAVVWRRALPVTAWAVILGASVVALVLARSTARLEPFSVILVALGLAALWLGYSRELPGIQWFPALTVDVLVLLATQVVSFPGGPREPYQTVSAAMVVVIALAMAVGYLTSFTLRTLAQRRPVGLFEVLQAAAVLAVGLGGAVRVAEASGSGNLILGLIGVALGLGSYAVAFVFVERRLGRGRDFLFYTSLGLLLNLYGWTVIAHGAVAAPVWCGLGLIAAVLGGRYDRITLRAHSAVYLVSAVAASGLGAFLFDAWFAPPSDPWVSMSPSSLLVLGSLVAGYGLLAFSQAGREGSRYARLPRFAVAVTVCLGLGAVAVQAAVWILPASVVDPGTLAAVRSLVLATATIALVVAGRSNLTRELTWLVYPLLAIGGAKLLLVDLQICRAVILLPVFAAYGLALILAPKLIRRKNPDPDSGGGSE